VSGRGRVVERKKGTVARRESRESFCYAGPGKNVNKGRKTRPGPWEHQKVCEKRKKGKLSYPEREKLRNIYPKTGGTNKRTKKKEFFHIIWVVKQRQTSKKKTRR